MRFKIEHGRKFSDWTRWVQPIKKGYRMKCCDCGLVHVVDFRINDGRVQFRMKRAAAPREEGK